MSRWTHILTIPNYTTYKIHMNTIYREKIHLDFHQLEWLSSIVYIITGTAMHMRIQKLNLCILSEFFTYILLTTWISFDVHVLQAMNSVLRLYYVCTGVQRILIYTYIQYMAYISIVHSIAQDVNDAHHLQYMCHSLVYQPLCHAAIFIHST